MDGPRVCVFASSSEVLHCEYLAAASALGGLLAREGFEVVFGGRSAGAMGAVADSALKAGGKVHGVLPSFMFELGWAHAGLTSLSVVDGMAERQAEMLRGTAAVVALPGGTGTWEEILEAITLKRLGHFLSPIVLVDVRGSFAPLRQGLAMMVREGFLDRRHTMMWSVVSDPADAVEAIRTAPPWSANSLAFATVQRSSSVESSDD